MLRGTFFWLSQRQTLFNFVKTNGMARAFARRFVAGETLDEAVTAVRAINARGMVATLDLLGESVASREDAAKARDQILGIVDRIGSERIDSNVSVKLTQLGLDIDRTLCRDNMAAVLERGAAHQTFVRVDMESSAYTERTLQLFEQDLFPRFGELVGVVIQSALRRSEQDVDRLARMRARVRLVKGAYAEPPDIAFPAKRDVDSAFAREAERLLEADVYPAIATHDDQLITQLERRVEVLGRARDRFEFQMLYGVRRDLQDRLHREGYRVRIYVPFGTHWYPYLMRRLAERPANVAFITAGVVKEAFART
jgi:proline dehydrogenase